MTIYDRVIDNARYDQIADQEDFQLIEIHTTQSPSGTSADLGKSADEIYYVRAYTHQADRDDRQRAYVYQADEGQRAALHFNAIRNADVERQGRIEDLEAQLDAERKRLLNPGAVGELVDRRYGFLESIGLCEETAAMRQTCEQDFVTSMSPSTY